MNRTFRRSSSAITCVIATVAFTILSGCHKQETKPEPVSAVTVDTQADGIHLKTGQAEFVLSANGTLSGRLKSGTQSLTLVLRRVIHCYRPGTVTVHNFRRRRQ